ncbi:MAG: TIGR00153 family protein [Proteobacteria bacterium]|nr:TIGR00153 family protein [Pseudomonadota bacterium]
MPSTLGSLFGGYAPFKGLQEHMRVVQKCAAEVVPLIEALIREDQKEVEVISARIVKLEAEADIVKNTIRSSLPRSLFMPVDRRDFLEVLDLQDSIADTAQDVAEMLLMRPTTVPEPMAGPLLALTKRCVEVCDLCAELIELFDELVAVGFSGRMAGKVEVLSETLNRAEDDTDELGISLARTLFSLEDELGAVSVMLWYQQIEWIGDLADFAEKVANRLRLVLAR